MKCITSSGGSLAEGVGNILANWFGSVMEAYNPNNDLHNWAYIKFAWNVKTTFIPQNDCENTYKLAFVETEDHKLLVINWEFNGKPAYRTEDLVIKHPSELGLWKCVGHLDDQIVLLNGKKTNPGPMEEEIVKSPFVQHAIMFGQERNQTGVLIELHEAAAKSHFTKDERTTLIEQIWPYIEQANQASPIHSQLDKPTILFVDLAHPLPWTPKGTIPHLVAIKLYTQDIDRMYACLEKDLGVVDKLSKCIANILGRDIDVEGDLFQQGMDSLTVTILHRTICGALHLSEDPHIQALSGKINQQMVFSRPTVWQLTELVIQKSIKENENGDLVAEAVEAINTMINKYISSLKYQMGGKECILLTRTTGALGSHLLAQLLASDQVEKVWAVNRKTGNDNRNRQHASFQDKLLDTSLLSSHKLIFLDTDLEQPNLDLQQEMFDEIRSAATIIIHNAWQVNFNLSLQSFEPSIRGLRNLLDLALASTSRTSLPRFVFTSSISVAGFIGPGERLSEISVKPENAATSMGYGQSKFVGEKVCLFSIN
ncbi:Acetyl-CoA synthetase [Ceratobasidium theobromae]|uniref:Acetyl-CoA synthetase n=1 Tax=Ceratobasidium theobromae TaxID=1582974 RepID=A0A5N5Q7N2_9AGAM|nr:Acetyl-CoA synthetase [Ceratobasidium theobromae]